MEMEMPTTFLDAMKPMVGAIPADLSVFGLIWYYISIPYRLFVVWPTYYLWLPIWWPVYVIMYYSSSLLSLFGGVEFDVPLWLYLLAYPDSYAPVFYFDFFYPPVTDETETTDETNVAE